MDGTEKLGQGMKIEVDGMEKPGTRGGEWCEWDGETWTRNEDRGGWDGETWKKWWRTMTMGRRNLDKE